VIVVDTNVIAYLLIPGTFTQDAERVFRMDPKWAAPFLWRSEFRNVLAVCSRQGRIDLATACALMERAEVIVRKREYSVGSLAVLRLADSCSCSAYDCEFAALAYDLKVPLITSDKGILSGFPDIAVPLAGFGSG